MKRILIFAFILFFSYGCDAGDESVYKITDTSVQTESSEQIENQDMSIENTSARVEEDNQGHSLIYSDSLNKTDTKAPLLYEYVHKNEITVVYREPLSVTGVIFKSDMQSDIKIGVFISNAADEKGYASDLAMLNSDSNVLFAEPNYITKIDALPAPNDTYYDSLWGVQKIGAEGAWEITTGSPDIVVAVLDTGIDYTHEDLAANIWTNKDEIAGNGIDDDENGLADDIRGFDFANWDTDPMDDHYHGTHCAGTIGAKSNNGTGIAGVSPTLKLMPIKILSSDGSGTTLNIYYGFKYAVENGADIISASFGGYGFSIMSLYGVYYAYINDVLVVAAAGNEANDNDKNYRTYPASYTYENIISVASSNQNDERSYFSNYGAASVDIFAPGENILSTVPGDGYSTLSGTSMATPHVSGAAALVLSMDEELKHTDTKKYILENALKIPALKDYVLTGARLDLNATIHDSRLLKTPSVINTSPADLSVNRALNSIISVTFSTDMDEASLNSGTVALKDSLSQIIDGNITYSNRTLTFTPDENLSEGAAYTLTVAKSVKNRIGVGMEDEYTFSFTTKSAYAEPEEQELSDTMPSSGQSGVNLNTKIEIQLDQELSVSMILGINFSLKDSAGESVEGKLSYLLDKLVFTPLETLESKMQYSVHLDIVSENILYDFVFTTE